MPKPVWILRTTDVYGESAASVHDSQEAAYEAAAEDIRQEAGEALDYEPYEDEDYAELWKANKDNDLKYLYEMWERVSGDYDVEIEIIEGFAQ